MAVLWGIPRCQREFLVGKEVNTCEVTAITRLAGSEATGMELYQGKVKHGVGHYTAAAHGL
jgi:hypothetical protein